MRYLVMLLPEHWLRRVDKYFRQGRHSIAHTATHYAIQPLDYASSHCGSVVYG